MSAQNCKVCNEPVRGTSSLCANCLDAKYVIQRAVSEMMKLHGVPLASGICAECGARGATVRDHRHYARPLEVENVCIPCNKLRGEARDLFMLIRKHRGIKGETQVEPEEDIEIPEDLDGHMDAYERNILRAALTLSKWNMTAAARSLGITFRTMRYRCDRLGIAF